jgi:class 3 adenylate cyclase/tetratricopeptide (TPR) repeat protein
LERYEAAFLENEVTEEVLCSLTAEDLKELGVTLVGHRRRMLDAIARLRQQNAPKLGNTNHPDDVEEPATAPKAPERRQLTVMFCDLVGSTALSARLDPEDLREVIGSYLRCVTEVVGSHDGFVAKYMGDGVLAYFGYPQAHEDDAEQAVRAGLAVIEAVERLGMSERFQVRIGVATGTTIVGDLIGTGSAQEQAVVGETPNFAARLQSLAEPGTLVIEDSTRRLIGSFFDVVDLGPQHLKGMAGPHRAWRVVGEVAVESRFEALRSSATPLVGRTEELELLLRRWHHAKEGNGQVALLSAEAGIGKSRLVAALRERIGPEAHIRLQYLCSPHREASALWPIVGQLERAAGFERGDPPGRKLDKLEALLASTSTSADEIALIADVLALPVSGRYPASTLSPQQKKQHTLEALLNQLVGLARQSPVLMVFEDLHWIDPTSRELLDLVMERVAYLPVLLILTCRPEFASPWTGQSHVTFMSLSRLGRREAAVLIERLTGEAGAKLPDDIVNEIAERTDGVPLFVEEVTNAVLESASDYTHAANRLSTIPSRTLTVPGTLHASLMARLDRLGSAAKEIAQIGAAIGREFSYELLASVAQRSEKDVSGALSRLVQAGLVFQRGTPPRADFTFKHSLVQDAAYGTLLRATRQELHALIAQHMPALFPDVNQTRPEVLAHHLTEAGLQEEATLYWQLAADRAALRQAHREAIAHCARGIEILKGIRDAQERERYELQFQVRLGNSVIAVKGWGAAEVKHAFERAQALCSILEKEELLQPVLVGLYYYHSMNAEMAAAERLGLELLAAGEAHQDRVLLVSGHKVLVDCCYKVAKFEQARHHFEEGMHLYEGAEWGELSVEHLDDPGPNMLVYGACVLWVLGYPDQAQRTVLRAVALARRRKHRLSLAHTVYMAGHLSELIGNWEGVRKANEETAVLATEWGLSGLRQQVTRRERLVAVATRCDADAMEYKRQHPQPGFARSLHDAVLAQAYSKIGEPVEGLRIIDTSLQWVDETGSHFFDAELHRIRADLLLMLGQQEAAKLSYENALAISRVQRARSWELRAATGLARLWRDQGRLEDARNLLAPVRGWFTEGFDAPDLKAAQTLLGELVPNVRPVA